MSCFCQRRACTMIFLLYVATLVYCASSDDVTSSDTPSSSILREQLRGLTSLNKRIRPELETLKDDDVIEVELREDPLQLVAEAIKEARKERKTHMTYVILNFGSGLKRAQQR